MCTLPIPQTGFLPDLLLEVRAALLNAEHTGEHFPVGFWQDMRACGICVHGRGRSICVRGHGEFVI